MPSELHATEVILLTAGVLLLVSATLGRLSSRSGAPILVLFLALGMAAGSEGIGGIALEDYSLTYRVATIALVLILFDGGLRTPVSVLRAGAAPAIALASVGVVLTAGVVGVVAHRLGFSWTQGLLLGAIVSPTDAATVFSLFRGSGIDLEERVGAVIELESGFNDPVAVMLAVALIDSAVERRPVDIGTLLVHLVAQVAIGAAVGAAVGRAGRWLPARIDLPSSGLYPVFTLSLAFVAYGAASLVFGSGFLAVYVAGVVLGNGPLPNRSALLGIHDFVAWASQIVMFVVLGLLAFPSRVVAVGPTGLVLAALLALVARPLAVVLCLTPFGFRAREILLVSWVGLRGAVPIVLATIPVLAHVDGAETIFDVVFFVVLVSALLQGGTAGKLTKWLGLAKQTGGDALG